MSRCWRAGVLIVIGTLLASCASAPRYSVTDLRLWARPGAQGFVLHSVIDRADVVFPDGDWKLLPFTTPGANYVIDPRTRAVLRFHAIQFGREFRQFLLWGYTVRQHEWVRDLDLGGSEDERQERFLRAWIDRALVQGRIGIPNRLDMAYPVLADGGQAAVLYPLRAEPGDQTVRVAHETVAGHRFAHAAILTRPAKGASVSLDTSIWISHFRYIPAHDVWRVYVAFSHVPLETPADRRKAVEEVFRRTLVSLELRQPR